MNHFAVVNKDDACSLKVYIYCESLYFGNQYSEGVSICYKFPMGLNHFGFNVIFDLFDKVTSPLSIEGMEESSAY